MSDADVLLGRKVNPETKEAIQYSKLPIISSRCSYIRIKYINCEIVYILVPSYTFSKFSTVLCDQYDKKNSSLDSQTAENMKMCV